MSGHEARQVHQATRIQQLSATSLRQPARHLKNELTGKRTSVPRHGDIDEELCREICKQLGIPKV